MYKRFFYNQKGFTLVELVVVTGIIGVIMLLVVANGRKFNDDLTVKTAGSEVSLAMRQAQNFGISVKESRSGSGTFTSAYGITFDLSNPTYMFLYADTNGNRVYDGTFACPGTDECREKVPLRGGVTINRVCASDNSGTLSCFNPSVRYLVVTYVRPNPEPVIYSVNQGNVATGGPWKKGYIELKSAKGTLLYVVTDSVSGQISVQNTMP